MKSTPAKAKDPLKPEVLAVIRSSFDGYNEPDGKRSPAKPAPSKSTGERPRLTSGTYARAIGGGR